MENAATQQSIHHYSSANIHSVSDTFHAAPSGGHSAFDTVVTGSMRNTRFEAAVDADAILSKAAERAAEQPITGEGAPTQKIERLEKRSEKAVTSMLSILGCFEEEPPFMLERKAII